MVGKPCRASTAALSAGHIAVQQSRAYCPNLLRERTMSASWNTKWGARRVRSDPPTLAEALVAAQGFTDDREGQAEIAARLMGVPVAEAKAELRRVAPDRRTTATVVTSARDKGGVRTVIIERKTSRRLQLPASRPGGSAHAR